jgi:hypothetical protein
MTMRPIEFTLSKAMSKPPAKIMAEIADMDRWSDFPGYGPMPGIERAEYLEKTAEMTGSRIGVTNEDGSTHQEDILAWEPGTRVLIKLHGFSAPVSGLADHFIEEWTFSEVHDQTQATRRFELHPKRTLTRPALWLISKFFKRAIAAHMDQIAAE